jgi:hypothetical protein
MDAAIMQLERHELGIHSHDGAADPLSAVTAVYRRACAITGTTAR